MEILTLMASSANAYDIVGACGGGDVRGRGAGWQLRVRWGARVQHLEGPPGDQGAAVCGLGSPSFHPPSPLSPAYPPVPPPPGELTEYARDVSPAIGREAVKAIGRIALAVRAPLGGSPQSRVGSSRSASRRRTALPPPLPETTPPPNPPQQS
jgi:hypothetical protein